MSTDIGSRMGFLLMPITQVMAPEGTAKLMRISGTLKANRIGEAVPTGSDC